MPSRLFNPERRRRPVRKHFSYIPGAHIIYVVPPACCRCRWFEHEVFDGPGHISFIYTDDTDIAMGNFTDQIVKGINQTLPFLATRPEVIQICFTCAFEVVGVDYDILVADLEQAFDGIDFLVFPIHHLLVHGGNLPPENREASLYKALRRRMEPDPHAVNVLDSPVDTTPGNELFDALRACGITTIRQPLRMKTYREFCDMASSCLNIPIGRMCEPACTDMERRLGIPWMRVPETYSPTRLQQSLAELCNRFGVDAPDIQQKVDECVELGRQAARAFEGHPVVVMEGNVIDSIDLTHALLTFGFDVVGMATLFFKDFGESDLVDGIRSMAPGITMFNNRDSQVLRFPQNAVVFGGPSRVIDGPQYFFEATTHGKSYGLDRIAAYYKSLIAFAQKELS